MTRSLASFAAAAHLCMLMADAQDTLGVVEGFYWATKDAVRGQDSQYTHRQRQDLLQFMGSVSSARSGVGLGGEARGVGAEVSALNTYVYTPQTPVVMQPWNATELAAWAETGTIARSAGIKLVLGLRPGYIDSAKACQQVLERRIAQCLQAGIADVVLAFDDVAGAGKLEQLELQRDLVIHTVSQGSINVWGMVPPAYFGSADVQVPSGLPPTWANKLAITQGVPATVRFLLAGEDANPAEFNKSQWPALANSEREIIFWDNDAAVDTSTRLPWGLPRGRDPALFSGKQYLLNLAFPPERVVHQVAAILLPEATSTGATIQAAGEVWADYLVEHGFVAAIGKAAVEHDLVKAMAANTYFDSIADLVATYPSFKCIWNDDGGCNTHTPTPTPTPTPTMGPTDQGKVPGDASETAAEVQCVSRCGSTDNAGYSGCAAKCTFGEDGFDESVASQRCATATVFLAAAAAALL